MAVASIIQVTSWPPFAESHQEKPDVIPLLVQKLGLDVGVVNVLIADMSCQFRMIN